MKSSSCRFGLFLSSSLLALSITGAAGAQTTQAGGDVAATEIGEIVVTATRQAETISRVPISVAAYDQARLDKQNVRRVDDIARLTPNLAFTRTGGANGGNSTIAIRGITSSIGAATTGIYIDDTPIQSRSLGNTASNTYPLVFDLERVEILRGPQGTLFGASAEGGTVRFITPRPSVTSYSTYARSEISQTDNGGMNYEAGVAVGGPLVQDKLGVRASVWYRRDGGWVDRVAPLTAGATSYPVVEKDVNFQDSFAAKLALSWQPTENLTLTPSIYYQNQRAHDQAVTFGQVRTTPSGLPAVFANVSDPDDNDFRTAHQFPLKGKDVFVLPALLVELEVGGVTIVSNTSYFDRTLDSFGDYTYLQSEIYGQRQPFITLPGENMYSLFRNTQKVFSQEFRIQSPRDRRLRWVVGGFYSRSKQYQYQDIVANYLDQLIINRTNGTSNILRTYGSNLLPGNVFFHTDINSIDSQLAAFAQVDFNVTEKLKLTVGGRISETKFDTDVLRTGPLAGGRVVTNGQQKETPFTPKLGVSYQADERTMFYASAAKGFRPGGAQAQLSRVACAADLAVLGIAETPPTYNSDSLWSYEAGAKARLFDDRLQLDGSGFYIKWKNIQQNVFARACSGSFTANLGTVTSQGFDVSMQMRPTTGLTLGLAVGYVKADYDDVVFSVPPAVLRAKGSRLNVRPVSVAASAQYDFTVGRFENYARVDYQYGSRGPEYNPADFGYDPLIARLAPANNLILRVGTRFSNLDVSVFADNATNASPVNYSRINATFTGVAPRPRVIGITATYRN